MSTAERAAEILEQGADAWESGRLEWIQGNVGNAITGVCAVGMCRYLISGHTGMLLSTANEWAAYNTYLHALSALRDKVPGRDVPLWNDEEGRTKDEVIDLFKEAAKDLRNQA